MSTFYTNIYQKARKTAGFTIEQAAELLYVSESSVKAYECGKTIPYDELVALMCHVYDAEWLGLEHLALHNAIIKRYAAAIPVESLRDNLVRFQAEKADVDRMMDSLLHAACRGHLDSPARKELRDLAGSTMALLASA